MPNIVQLDLILDHNWNAGARTLCFLVAITFVGGTALTNVRDTHERYF